jgi:hypothetical protein
VVEVTDIGLKVTRLLELQAQFLAETPEIIKQKV